jgi:dolichol-phosphate mannosyltransferase
VTQRSQQLSLSLASMMIPRRPWGRLFLGCQSVAAIVVLRRLGRAARQPKPLQATESSLRTEESAGDSSLASDENSRPVGVLPMISVVVPARNEAARVGPCLAALRDAPHVVEVIVVDDQSSDGTAELARSCGATVITGTPLPSGWAGKCWALQQGLDAAIGDWVVCLDADTRPSPNLASAVVVRCLADGVELITVAGRFECPTAGSRWLHPAMLTTLIYRFGPPGTSGSGRELANGQCMAFDRRRFIADGGFDAVRGHLVEDVALIRQRRALGTRVGMVDGAGLLEVRMFESLAETWSGWGRSLNLPGVESRSQQLLDVGVLALTQAVPLWGVASALARRRLPHPLHLILLVARLGTLGGTSRVYQRTDLAYWLSPLADGPAVARMAWGVFRPSRSWRGRTYAP